MIPTPGRYFITGTDTGVGKTWVSAGILARWKAHDPFYIKPLQTGVETGDDDLREVAASAGVRGVTLRQYALPRAPWAAARAEGSLIHIEKLISDCQVLLSQNPVSLVEGAGGALVPITENYDMADFMKDLGLPVWVVARATLGTVNHSRLTAEALRHRGVVVAGVFLNPGPGGTVDELAQENRGFLERRLGCVVEFWDPK